MPLLVLPKEEAKEVLYGDSEKYSVVVNEMVDRSRWSIHYDLIITDGEKFYEGSYSRGATESQEEGAWEYDDFAEFMEVEPYDVVVIKYRAVKETNVEATTVQPNV